MLKSTSLALALTFAIIAPLSASAQTKILEIGPFSASHRDAEMVSPKSVLFHPTQPKFYVNALEAGKTLVYSSDTFQKQATIEHGFSSHDKLAPGKVFFGKPVEGWFTHQGRYLWITYYRWSDDPHAQKASGFSVIDTQSDRIVRTYATGNIPKFITADADSKTLAVTLWGANQVEFYDIKDPLDAKRLGVVSVGPEVRAAAGSDRDSTCGFCLRGTAFLPGTDLVAVARMGGGGLALVDSHKMTVQRTLFKVPLTPRHLQVYRDWLYMSANVSGTVARIRLDDLSKAATDKGFTPEVQSRKVGEGARTLKVVDEKVYAALNISKKIVSMNLDFTNLTTVDAPAYPVGLDVKGNLVAVTSQGRSGVGGHRVWLYSLAPPTAH